MTMFLPARRPRLPREQYALSRRLTSTFIPTTEILGQGDIVIEPGGLDVTRYTPPQPWSDEGSFVDLVFNGPR